MSHRQTLEVVFKKVLPQIMILREKKSTWSVSKDHRNQVQSTFQIISIYNQLIRQAVEKHNHGAGFHLILRNCRDQVVRAAVRIWPLGSDTKGKVDC